VKTSWREIVRNDHTPACQSCRNNEMRISQAKGDLAAAARKAARRPTDRNIAAVKKAKKWLDDNKEVAADHELICEELVTVKGAA